MYDLIVNYYFQIVQNKVLNTDGSGDLDRCFRRANRHVVRKIRTFWTGSRNRILLDSAGRERTQPERVPLYSCVFGTLSRYYCLLRQNLLHRSPNCVEEQRQDSQHGTHRNQSRCKIYLYLQQKLQKLEKIQCMFIFILCIIIECISKNLVQFTQNKLIKN